MSKSFSLMAILVAVCTLLISDVAFAQPGGGGGRGGQRGFGGFGGGDNMLGLLSSEQVQNELELVDDQIEELEAIREASTQAIRDVFQGMRDVSPDERQTMMAEMQEKVQEKMKSFEKEANAVLLPHQKERLKQISFQASGRNRGAGGSFSNEALLDELGVSEEQRKELEEATAAAREELQEKYRELVRVAEEEILGVLTKDQREKYKELIGEPFDTQNLGGGFGGRGGPPGGRGGQQGERGGDGGRGGQGDRSDF